MKTEYQLPEPVVIDTHLPTNHKTRGYTAEQMQAAIHAAVMEEREACANLCEQLARDIMNGNTAAVFERRFCANSIRNRSNT